RVIVVDRLAGGGAIAPFGLGAVAAAGNVARDAPVEGKIRSRHALQAVVAEAQRMDRHVGRQILGLARWDQLVIEGAIVEPKGDLLLEIAPPRQHVIPARGGDGATAGYVEESLHRARVDVRVAGYEIKRAVEGVKRNVVARAIDRDLARIGRRGHV